MLDLFKDRLPRKVYCSDDLDAEGCYIRSAKHALKKLLVQSNGHQIKWWFVFDVDKNNAALAWDENDCPAPNLVAQNPINGHAHLFYALETSLRTGYGAKEGPLRYAYALEIALRDKLGADKGYTGFLSKNPISPHWRVMCFQERPYSFADLHSWLDLTGVSRAANEDVFEDYGLGRNCTLFHRLRKWSYWQAHFYSDIGAFFAAVRAQGEAINAEFSERLWPNEVKNTAWSIARFSWRHMGPDAYRDLQSRQGQRKGLKKRMASMAEVQWMHCQGHTQKAIAERVGVTQQTVSNWLKKNVSK